MSDVSSDQIKDALSLLFVSFGVAFESASETKRLVSQSFAMAARGKPADLVKRVVNEYITGEIDRLPSKRGKLPTSDEFGYRLRQLVAERKAQGKAVSDDATALAPAYGPMWSVKLYSLLLQGPDVDMRAPNSFFRTMIEKGGEIGERYRLEHQANNGFRLASLMLSEAEDGKGTLARGSLERFTGMTEAVPVDCDVFAAWRDLHRARGWPWIGNTGKMRVVYFPQGGPDALAVFADALNAG